MINTFRSKYTYNKSNTNGINENLEKTEETIKHIDNPDICATLSLVTRHRTKTNETKNKTQKTNKKKRKKKRNTDRSLN